MSSIDHAVHETDAPPAGEEIHLPGPSLVPLFNAVGVAMALIGLATFHLLTYIGIVVFLLTLFRWIGDTRRDISELPLEHGHH
jgi:hypothetical protein